MTYIRYEITLYVLQLVRRGTTATRLSVSRWYRVGQLNRVATREQPVRPTARSFCYNGRVVIQKTLVREPVVVLRDMSHIHGALLTHSCSDLSIPDCVVRSNIRRAIVKSALEGIGGSECVGRGMIIV